MQDLDLQLAAAQVLRVDIGDLVYSPRGDGARLRAMSITSLS